MNVWNIFGGSQMEIIKTLLLIAIALFLIKLILSFLAGIVAIIVTVLVVIGILYFIAKVISKQKNI